MTNPARNKKRGSAFERRVKKAIEKYYFGKVKVHKVPKSGAGEKSIQFQLKKNPHLQIKPSFKKLIDHKCDLVIDLFSIINTNVCVECKRTFKNDLRFDKEWITTLQKCANKHKNLFILAFAMKNAYRKYMMNVSTFMILFGVDLKIDKILNYPDNRYVTINSEDLGVGKLVDFRYKYNNIDTTFFILDEYIFKKYRKWWW